MIAALSPSLRRCLALAILLGLVVAAWSLLVAPLMAMAELRAAGIAEATEQLAHLQALIARQPDLQRRAQEAGRQFAAGGGLWPGPSAAMTAAGMLDRLRQAVTDSGGQLRTSSEPAETAEHGMRRVALHFSIEGPLATVLGTLASVEATRPALFVDALKIAAPQFEVSPDTEPRFVLELDVSGYSEATPR